MFEWRTDSQRSTIDLLFQGRMLLHYMHAYDRTRETSKPFYHLYGYGATALLTKGAGGLYCHHRGLFIGWRNVSCNGQTYDFWHCEDGAHQRHSKVTEEFANMFCAKLTTEINWNDKNDRPVLVEQRHLTVIDSRAIPGLGRNQFDISTTLTPCRGPTTLAGDRHHAGCQLRAAQTVAESESARFVRPYGFPIQPEAFEHDSGPEHYRDMGWVLMTIPIGNTQFSVQYCAERHPATQFSERPYGRMGAARELLLEEGEPSRLRYRLNVFHGEPPARDVLAACYADFLVTNKNTDAGHGQVH